MKIKVTQEHIDKGKIGDCDFCPIALTVKDHLKCFVRVGSRAIELQGIMPVFLPTVARDFVYDFDREWPVHPFEFELDI